MALGGRTTDTDYDKDDRICANCSAFLLKSRNGRLAKAMTGECRITGAVKFQTVSGDEWCRDGFESKHEKQAGGA